MNNSGASESTEIASHVSNKHASEVVQTVQDIENQNMQVAIEIETPIVMGTSVNQQQHTVQDIENLNFEEFNAAPPNFVQQEHTVQDNDPNQNNCEGVDDASPSVSFGLSIQDNGREILEEFDVASPNIIQQQYTGQDNDPDQNSEGIVTASPSLSIQDNGSQTWEGPAEPDRTNETIFEVIVPPCARHPG